EPRLNTAKDLLNFLACPKNVLIVNSFYMEIFSRAMPKRNWLYYQLGSKYSEKMKDWPSMEYIYTLLGNEAIFGGVYSQNSCHSTLRNRHAILTVIRTSSLH